MTKQYWMNSGVSLVVQVWSLTQFYVACLHSGPKLCETTTTHDSVLVAPEAIHETKVRPLEGRRACSKTALQGSETDSNYASWRNEREHGPGQGGPVCFAFQANHRFFTIYKKNALVARPDRSALLAISGHVWSITTQCSGNWGDHWCVAVTWARYAC